MHTHATATFSQRFLFMLGLIVAGEAVFALPFQVARFFRPTMLEVFEISATELGAAQGVYGIVAMIAYFSGGPLADRFPARKLMAVSLWSTAAGGLYMATFPGYLGMSLVFGFFGLTTILLFWAALIRATRDWGGNTEQGRAFGILDGGRGLLAAALASIGAMIFGLAFPAGYDAASFAERSAALASVIYGYTIFTALIGVFIWFALKDPDKASNTVQSRLSEHVLAVLKMPAVMLQALIVICAYVGYKGLDNYTLFAVQVYAMDEVAAANMMATTAWVRPVAALMFGLLADRFSVTRILLIGFALLLASDLYFAIAKPSPGTTWIIFSNIVLTCVAVYGFRGIYFALFEETRVPLAMTGTAVGIVSFIGYTPDIFVTLVAGLFIDNFPGVQGHQYFFFFLAGFAGIGLLAAFALQMVIARNNRLSAQPAPG